jgi:hypothetical protein
MELIVIKVIVPPLKRRFVSALKIRYRIGLQAQKPSGESPEVSQILIVKSRVLMHFIS